MKQSKFEFTWNFLDHPQVSEIPFICVQLVEPAEFQKFEVHKSGNAITYGSLATRRIKFLSNPVKNEKWD